MKFGVVECQFIEPVEGLERCLVGRRLYRPGILANVDREIDERRKPVNHGAAQNRW